MDVLKYTREPLIWFVYAAIRPTINARRQGIKLGSLSRNLHRWALSFEKAISMGLRPIRSAALSYGETQISRFQHGWLLLRMVVFVFRKIKE